MADDQELAPSDEVIDSTPDAPVAEETLAPDQGTAANPTPADKPVESFINPADLPEEIKPHWKRMHAAYTKWIEKERNPARQDLEMLAKFRSDPAFAKEIIQFEAARLGVSLAPAPQAPPQPAAPIPQQVPENVVKAVAAQLDPSLQWMAPAVAAGQWAAALEANRPLVEKDRAREKAARDTEWGALTSKLTETAPGWEAHETDMNALLDWLRGPDLNHPAYGDKLTFLYNSVTGGSAAKAQAIQAMSQAARSASRTGQPARATLPNIEERVRKASTPREAMKIASDAAIEELRARGLPIPD